MHDHKHDSTVSSHTDTNANNHTLHMTVTWSLNLIVTLIASVAMTMTITR